MEAKIKKLSEHAVIPKYSQEGDAAMDLVAVSINQISPTLFKFGTGLAFEIPEGHVGLVYPRSSITKTNLRLANSVGIIDSKYRGEVSFIFDKISNSENDSIMDLDYFVGDRIGQIMIVPYPQIEFIESDELSTTVRGTGGFGSTGR